MPFLMLDVDNKTKTTICSSKMSKFLIALILVYQKLVKIQRNPPKNITIMIKNKRKKDNLWDLKFVPEKVF